MTATLAWRAAPILLCFAALAQAHPAPEAEDHDPKTNPRPWVRPVDKPGFHLGFPAASVTPMLSSKDTGGAMSGAVEMIEKDYYGPAHVHYETDEVLILVEGSLYARVQGEDMTLTPGQWLSIPAGNVHAFRATGEPAKMLVMHLPGDEPPTGPGEGECDRSKFSAADRVDPEVMSRWYHNCLPDFFMVEDHGMPFEPPAKPPMEAPGAGAEP
ncbi:MAG: cupin domain-containing protein [Pseudomonadota bacterium]